MKSGVCESAHVENVKTGRMSGAVTVKGKCVYEYERNVCVCCGSRVVNETIELNLQIESLWG